MNSFEHSIHSFLDGNRKKSNEGLMEKIKLKVRGPEILNNPLLNKGTAFTQQERDDLGLNGLLPNHISTAEEQIERSYKNFSRRRTPLGKYNFLISLLSRNELLFYQFVARYPAEMLPFIYTPTVGEAAVQYSSIYFHQRGLYISYPQMEKIEAIIGNCPLEQVEVVVVTDGERILGLGDQGIGGMTIAVGKLSLYTLFGGIHPANTLPILLDLGTNNNELIQDKLYLGWRHPRITGAEYDIFIDRFVKALKKRYPNVLLQWEDFGRQNARRLLDKYRKQILSFNDDIEGTGAVALSALIAAVKVAKGKFAEQKIAILGGGSAGTGIADMIVKALEEEGLSRDEALQRIYLVDIDGLIHFNSPNLHDAQRAFAHPRASIENWKIPNSNYISLRDVVVNARPTILIGVSAQGGAFTQEIIDEMTQYCERPIVFPLSNPTSKAECTPEEAIAWTKGKVIMATGSPFQPVNYQDKTYRIGQCNNVYIFPGVGLGALAAQAESLNDAIFLEAARTLASCSPAIQDPTSSLFPAIEEVRGVSRIVALAVAKKISQEGLSSLSLSAIEERLEKLVWTPSYPSYI